MIKVKATTIQRRRGLYENQVVGRIEIQWSLDESWLNLGLFNLCEHDWVLLLLLVSLGARHASSIMEFHLEDKSEGKYAPIDN